LDGQRENVRWKCGGLSFYNTAAVAYRTVNKRLSRRGRVGGGGGGECEKLALFPLDFPRFTTFIPAITAHLLPTTVLLSSVSTK